MSGYLNLKYYYPSCEIFVGGRGGRVGLWVGGITVKSTHGLDGW